MTELLNFAYWVSPLLGTLLGLAFAMAHTKRMWPYLITLSLLGYGIFMVLGVELGLMEEHVRWKSMATAYTGLLFAFYYPALGFVGLIMKGHQPNEDWAAECPMEQELEKDWTTESSPSK